jgi:hypothetical protein
MNLYTQIYETIYNEKKYYKKKSNFQILYIKQYLWFCLNNIKQYFQILYINNINLTRI